MPHFAHDSENLAGAISGKPPLKPLTGWITSVNDTCKPRRTNGGDIVRISGRQIGLGMAAIAVAIGSLVTPAAADSPLSATGATGGAIIASNGFKIGELHKRGDGTKAPAELGNPSEWGVVEVKMDDSVITPLGEACVPASGGNWCYGWYLTGVDATQKRCYSNYLHETRQHRSTVELAGVTVHSGIKPPGEVASASRTAGAAYTCYTYYSVE